MSQIRTVKGGRGDGFQKSYAVVVDYMDEPEPSRAPNIPTSFRDFMSFFDKVVPPIPLVRGMEDMKDRLQRTQPKTMNKASKLSFLGRVNGIVRAVDDSSKLRRSKTFLNHLFSVYGPNVEYGFSHDVRLPIEDEERVFYTLTAGFANQDRPSIFVRKFREIPNSMHIATTLLTTIGIAANQGIIMRVKNAEECLDLMVNDAAVRASYEGAEEYMDGNGYLTSKGLFIASLLRKPKRLHEWANLPEEKIRMDGWERTKKLSCDLSDPVNFLVHQGMRRLDLVSAKQPTPEVWENYVTGTFSKDGIVVYARDLVWCRPVESCRGAIRTLSENGFPPETKTLIMVPNGQEWKPTFNHTLSELDSNRSITERMFEEARIRMHTEEHPFRLH
ncbi:MAG: hypothetical protein ABH834_01660 [Candidatus Altiarchaeota archaeon]